MWDHLIKDLKNIKWDALPIYDDKYLETKIRTCGMAIKFILIFMV